MKLAIFSILALCLSPISLAQTDKPNSCEQALQNNLANYVAMLKFGIASQAFPIEDLTRLSAAHLNPLGSGLKAPQRLLKTTIDKVIVKFNDYDRQEALILVQKLLNEHSRGHDLKVEAQAETKRVVAPKIIAELAIPMSQAERKQGVRTIRMKSSTNQNLLATLIGKSLSYKLLNLSSPDVSGQVIDFQPASKGLFAEESLSIVLAKNTENEEQLVGAWVKGNEAFFHNFATQQTWTLRIDSRVNAKVMLSRNQNHDVFFAIGVQDGWQIGELGPNGPKFTGKIPELAAGTSVIQALAQSSVGIVFTDNGDPRYFGISREGAIQVRDGRSGQLLQHWQGPEPTARRIRRLMLPAVVDGKLILAFLYTDWNSSSRKPSHLVFLQEGDPNVYRLNALEGETEPLGWLHHSRQLAFAFSNNGKLSFIEPFSASSRLALPSRFFKNLVAKAPLADIQVRPTIGHSVNELMEACDFTSSKDFLVNGKHLWICVGGRRFYVLELGPNLEVVSYYSREIPPHQILRTEFFLDDATQEVLIALNLDVHRFGIFAVRKEGPFQLYEGRGPMHGGFYRVQDRLQDPVLLNSSFFDGDQFRIQVIQVVGDEK